jgi:hypothetical protein
MGAAAVDRSNLRAAIWNSQGKDNAAMPSPAPDERAIAEAKRQGQGWVYKIEGNYGPNDNVPPQAVVGAWKVEAGQIVGEFLPNPNYKPS